jgi:hypothetical protein
MKIVTRGRLLFIRQGETRGIASRDLQLLAMLVPAKSGIVLATPFQSFPTLSRSEVIRTLRVILKEARHAGAQNQPAR